MSDFDLPPGIKLGRLPSPPDPARQARAAYADYVALPVPPATVNWLLPLASGLGVMLNDRLGDCTCAALGHCHQVWTAAHGAEDTPADGDILAAYEAVGGYRPGQPATDRGANMVDALTYFQQVGIGGRRILGWVPVRPTDDRQAHLALYLFGTLYAGANLDSRAPEASVWQTPTSPGTIGGHAFTPGSDDPAGSENLITWGTIRRMTRAWRAERVDELYAPWSPAWHGPDGRTPNGHTFAEMYGFYNALGGLPIPQPPDPTPTVDPCAGDGAFL